MKDEATHYFNLAINRLVNHIKSGKNLPIKPEISIDDQRSIAFMLLEILKEQVPNENTRPPAR